MKLNKRQKLCYNCDGDVDLDVIVCPFCAADLRVEKSEQMQARASHVAKPMHVQGLGESLYPSSQPQRPPPFRETVVEKPEPVSLPQSGEEGANPVWASLLIALGGQLFVLGLLLAAFSRQGVLTLQWDARLWFLYLFASVPFLVFGYRALSRL